jgi:hypothetical protein
MTRKHFKEIARILGENNASISIIREFMNFCMEQNDNFNRTTFLDAVKKHSIEKSLENGLTPAEAERLSLEIVNE